jgi:hypothetical protein
MTTEEFRHLLADMHLHVDEAAVMLGATKRNVGQWYYGERKVPHWAARALFLMNEEKLDPGDWADALRGAESTYGMKVARLKKEAAR